MDPGSGAWALGGVLGLSDTRGAGRREPFDRMRVRPGSMHGRGALRAYIAHRLGPQLTTSPSTPCRSSHYYHRLTVAAALGHARAAGGWRRRATRALLRPPS